jgi:cell shape-determining protein MreD
VKKTLVALFVLIAAATLQSQGIRIYGSAPDFLMAATMAMALVVDPALGAVFGFAAGLTHASIVGLSFGGFITSRALLGFGVGSLRAWVFQDNPVVLLAAALLGTMACEGLYFLVEPARGSRAALAQLPTESIYNAILAVICYVLIRRVMETESQSVVGS